MQIILGLAIAGCSWIQISYLIRKKYWRELAAFLTFLLPGFIISVLLAAGITVPNPVKGIEFVVNYMILSKTT